MTTTDVLSLINIYQVESKRFKELHNSCDSISWEIVDVPRDVYEEIADRFNITLMRFPERGQFCIGTDGCFIHVYCKPS